MCARVLLRDLARQALELLMVEHLVIDHAKNEFLGRAAAEAVNDIFHGAHGDVLTSVQCFVDEGSAFHLVRDVPLFLETAQHGADGGILHRSRRGKRFSAGLRRSRAVAPDVIHHTLFHLSQIL